MIVDIEEYLYEVSTEVLLDELYERGDLEDYKEEIFRTLNYEEEPEEFSLEEFDHSLFYMSEDDFSKLLEIIEYHKSKRIK